MSHVEHEHGQVDDSYERQGSFKIILSADRDLQAKLARKLEEYRGREVNQYVPAESNLEVFKLLVLEKLLQDGVVDSYDFKNELEAKMGEINESVYLSAFSIISDYAHTGGANNLHGTGLK